MKRIFMHRLGNSAMYLLLIHYSFFLLFNDVSLDLAKVFKIFIPPGFAILQIGSRISLLYKQSEAFRIAAHSIVIMNWLLVIFLWKSRISNKYIDNIIPIVNIFILVVIFLGSVQYFQYARMLTPSELK